MGMFDDLIPGASTTSTPPGTTSGGMFDDLIPGGEASAPPAPGLFDDLVPKKEAVAGGSLARGFYGMKQGGAALLYALGALDEDTLTKELVEGNKNIKAYPKPEEQIALEKGLNEEGFWALLEHPAGIPSVLGEMAASSVASIPFAIAGGAAGSPLGPIGSLVGGSAGVGLAAGADDFGRSFNAYLEGAGVDFNDPTQVRLALDNKELINQAIWFAAERAAISGPLNAIGAAVGGKFALRFWKPETRLLSKPGLQGAGAITGTSVGTQAAVTAGQQIATGQELDPNAIAADAFLAGLVNIVPMSVPAFMSKNKGRGMTQDKPPPPPKDQTLEWRWSTEQDAWVLRPKGHVDPALAPSAKNEDVTPGVIPTPKEVEEPFQTVDPRTLEALKLRVEEAGPERATPLEWNEFFSSRPKKTGLMQDQTREPGPLPPEILPAKAFTTDEPVSKAEILREIEARQLVVEQGEPLILPKKEGAAVTEVSPFRMTLTLSKDIPNFDIPDPNSPVVLNTRSDLVPVAQLATTTDRDTQGRRVLTVDKIEAATDAPLTSKMEEVLVQRVMRWAADEGYDFVSWPQGTPRPDIESGPVVLPVVRDAPAEAQATLKEIFSDFYAGKTREKASVSRVANDALAPRVTVKVGAKDRPKVSFDAVSTREFRERVSRRNRPIAPRSSKRGVTSEFSQDVSMTMAPGVRINLGLIEAARLSVRIMSEVESAFKLDKPVHVTFTKEASTAFGDYNFVNGIHEIQVHLRNHPTAESIYTTVMHEFGHALAVDKWGNANHALQQSIMEAYVRTILDPVGLSMQGRKITPKNPSQSFSSVIQNAGTMGEATLRRRNFVKIMQENLPESDQVPLWAYVNAGEIKRVQYELSFAEFFAEQVAKWATTEVKPMTLVEKFFSSLYHRINAMFALFKQKFPTSPRAEAEPEIAAWLNSFTSQISVQFSPGWMGQLARSVRANLRALRAAGQPTGGLPVPQTPMTTAARTMMANVFGHTGVPAQIAANAVHADRLGRYMKYMGSLTQVAKQNPHIRALQLYVQENVDLQNERIRLLTPANDRLTIWRGIGRKQNEALNGVIRDYAEMRYRTQKEIQNKVSRLPTQQELEAIFAQHNLSPQGRSLFAQIVQDFSDFLTYYEQLMIQEAMKIGDPVAAAARAAEIQNSVAAMRKVPYFPFMRFGNYTITVRDSGGVVVHFETFETRRMRDAAAKMAESIYPPQAFTMNLGLLTEDVKPLIGLPPGLLEKIQENLHLSQNQKDMMEQLRFELAPAKSFRHRFQMKNRTSGYSEDFMRAYANYMFHGSSFLARTKHVDALESFIKTVRLEGDFMPDGTERHAIANFMSEHLANTVLDARSDWSFARGAIFHWALGFNPAAAAINLTQLPILTYPYIADKFGGAVKGDLGAMGSMIKAITGLSTYYRTATLENLPDPIYRSMSRAIKDGTLNEAMAPMLAATSEGRNLIPFMSKNAAEKAYHRFSQASAWMFSQAEKMNRRVTFRTAWDLAYRNPGLKHVQEIIQQNPTLYQRLRNEGWTHQEAAAHLAAVDAVNMTQFIYAGWNRPRALRGKLGVVLVFKSFLMNTLFTMWNNPKTALRSIIVLMGLGGVSGIPGYEDVVDIARTLGYQLFGKDFNLDKEMREFLVDFTEMDPDLIMRGWSRRGFGIPALADLLGIPMPEIDMSRQIGLGQILPVEVYKLAGPVSEPDTAISQGLQQAGGAAFSVGFNLYRALMDHQLSVDDWKRWQLAMPRVLANISHAWDVAKTGVDRSRAGTPIQTYDPNDTEQMMEIISMGLGFTPLATSQVWGRIQAVEEAKQFWRHKREILLMQLGHAFTIGDMEQRESVMAGIRQFNQELPDVLRSAVGVISADVIEQSVRKKVEGFTMRKAGIPTKKDIPLIEDLSEEYPIKEVGNRPIPRFK
jgi:hypothetical protein